MDIQYFKEKLEAEKSTLLEELARIGIQDTETGAWQVRVDVSEEISDMNDMGDRDEEATQKQNTIDILSVRLGEVEHALDSIEDGTYGICEVSGQPIEEERLMANPAATTCMAHMK